MADQSGREGARDNALSGDWSKTQWAETANLVGSSVGDYDGDTSRSIRLLGVLTGAVVGLTLALNVLLAGYTNWIWTAVTVVAGIVYLWDATIVREILERGFSMITTLLAMLPVTYGLGEATIFDGESALVPLFIWVAIAAILLAFSRRILGNLLSREPTAST